MDGQTFRPHLRPRFAIRCAIMINDNDDNNDDDNNNNNNKYPQKCGYNAGMIKSVRSTRLVYFTKFYFVDLF